MSTDAPCEVNIETFAVRRFPLDGSSDSLCWNFTKHRKREVTKDVTKVTKTHVCGRTIRGNLERFAVICFLLDDLSDPL